jgi:hypothetical protein
MAEASAAEVQRAASSPRNAGLDDDRGHLLSAPRLRSRSHQRDRDHPAAESEAGFHQTHRGEVDAACAGMLDAIFAIGDDLLKAKGDLEQVKFS